MTIADSRAILDDCAIGDSIAINGVCLTVTEFDNVSFKVGLSPETLNRTCLGQLKSGDGVNLERAMGAKSRFGGHFVQGHVDATVTILSRVPDQNSLRLLFHIPRPESASGEDLLPYIIPKGYVTLDGASLTITSVSDSDRTFGIMLIAHTQSKITLSKKRVGELVNVEVDMVGKYVERSVLAALGSLGNESTADSPIKIAVERIVERKLAQSHRS